MTNKFIITQLKSINIHEILFDVVLIVYSEFFLYGIITGGRWFVELMGLNAFLLAGVFIDFFIIWYLGIVLKSYWSSPDQIWLKFLTGIAAIWILVSLHFGIGINSTDIFKPDMISLWIFGYMLVMIGIGGGMIFAITEFSRAKNISAARFNALKKLFPFGLWAMNIYLAYYILETLHFKKIIPGIILWSVLTISGFAVFHFLEKKALAKNGPVLPDKIREFSKKYILPFIIITLLCLWDEIYIWGKITPALKRNESVSAAGLMVYLFFSGIIPMRLLLVFQPPVNIYNILIGLFSIGYFIISVLNLLDSIFLH